MSEIPTPSLPSWNEGAASKGFGIYCLRFPEGERFTFMVTDPAKVRELGFRAIETLLLEGELRAQLAQAGFSEANVEEKLQRARIWATTTTASLTEFWR